MTVYADTTGPATVLGGSAAGLSADSTGALSEILPAAWVGVNDFGDGQQMLRIVLGLPAVQGTNVTYVTKDGGVHTPYGAAVHSGEFRGNFPNDGSIWLVGANISNHGNVILAPNGGRGSPQSNAGSFIADGAGHINSAWTQAPGAPTNVNANIDTLVVAGNDRRGTVTFNTGAAAPAAGVRLFTFNFAQAYVDWVNGAGHANRAPLLVLPANLKATLFNGGYSIDAITATTFDVYAAQALPNSQNGLVLGYMVEG